MIAVALALVCQLVALETPASDQAPLPVLEIQGNEAAETLFRQAVTSYDAHDYLRAIDLFKRVYELTKAPELLFDIGQSYRALGDCHKAFAGFGAFIAVAGADDPLVPKARARQIDLRACAIESITSSKQERPASKPEPRASPALLGSLLATPAISKEKTLELPQSARFTGTGKGMGCTGAAGGAMALAGFGLVLGGAAWSLAGTVESSMVWGTESQRADDRGRALGQAATFAFVGAGVTAAAATVLCWLGWREGRAGGP